MSEKDDAAAAYYSDPAHRMSDGPGYALPGRPARLSGHVPIRFDRVTIAAIKQFSDEDGMTVSAWVRKVVDREIRRRISLRTRTTSTRSGEIKLWQERSAPSNTTTAATPAMITDLQAAI